MSRPVVTELARCTMGSASNGMRVFIKVKAGSKIEKIEKISEGTFIVWVTAPAKKGKANAALIKVLARHFGVPPSAVKILSGYSSPRKVVETP